MHQKQCIRVYRAEPIENKHKEEVRKGSPREKGIQGSGRQIGRMGHLKPRLSQWSCQLHLYTV